MKFILAKFILINLLMKFILAKFILIKIILYNPNFIPNLTSLSLAQLSLVFIISIFIYRKIHYYFELQYDYSSERAVVMVRLGAAADA